MDGYLRRKGIFKAKKNIKMLSLAIILSASLFFCPFLSKKKSKQEQKPRISQSAYLDLTDPLWRIDKNTQNQSSLKMCPRNEYIGAKEPGKDKSVKYLAMVSGFPIEEMLPEILKRDEKEISFLIGIAKKESNWGKYAPQKEGKDCYNYWGYKGKENPTSSGYSCFDSPEQAVAIVGDRISDLINQGINTPSKMLVWKCGSSCQSHNPQDVRKWVTDVSVYF